MIDAGTILQMIRMEHHITRHELAKQFGTTYEAIKEIEDNNGDVPDEWLIYLYNNYDLSPEELYLLEYISDMPQGNRMKRNEKYVIIDQKELVNYEKIL